MLKRQELTHPAGEEAVLAEAAEYHPVEVDTYAGKVQVYWDPDSSVTPLGQLPFFIEYLKVGGRFDPWVLDCPLEYKSNNAPKKTNVLGSLLLSILSGHRRYAHISTLMNEQVNAEFLGMTKVVSDDSARRALKRIEEVDGVEWLQRHLYACYEGLLTTPWILDIDVTIKPLYGHQEGAVVGYNPHKPGRPSHTYHSYLIGKLRLVLEVVVQPGDQSHACHSMPGLMALLDRLPGDAKPEFIRGDCDFGNNNVMSELETTGHRYLFKLRKSKWVNRLIEHHHGKGNWTVFNDRCEAKEASLQLLGWKSARRVVIVRRRLNISRANTLALACSQKPQRDLAFITGPEDMRRYEYAVLVTNLEEELVTVIQHYRDRADCENCFDEIKNQWGWGGYTTKDLKSSQFMSRMIALIYNWWTLFARLANPHKHTEAITSRPLLLSSVGRVTKSARQTTLTITNQSNQAVQLKSIYHRLAVFFRQLKKNAPQLTRKQIWNRILCKAMEAFPVMTEPIDKKRLLASPAI